VLVLDTCEGDHALFLLEINPFSGADLYACDRAAVVSADSRFATASPEQGASQAAAAGS